MNLRSNGKWKRVAFYVTIFVGLMLFFACAHPLYIFDSDDWKYIATSRLPIPVPFIEWNPIKVLPEVLMPFVAQMGVSIIRPFMGDYIASMAFVAALVLALFVILYLVSLDHLLAHTLKINAARYWLVLSFLLLHFLPFGVVDAKRRHMFYAHDVNCVVNYTIAGLLNAAAVMFVLSGSMSKWKWKKAPFLDGLLLLGVYLCINSNLYDNYLLPLVFGTELFWRIIDNIKTGRNRKNVWLKECIGQNTVGICVILLWILSALTELSGGRAYGNTAILLKDAACQFAAAVIGLNKVWLAGGAFAIAAGILVYIHFCRKGFCEIEQTYIQQFRVCGLSLTLSMIYIILLSAKVDASYCTRADVMFGWMFWYLLLAVLSLGYLLKRCPQANAFLPILLFMIMSVTVTDGAMYADCNVSNLNAQTVKEIDEYIIWQVQQAEKDGDNTVQVKIPVTESDDWPIAVKWGPDGTANALYKHGLVKWKMKIKFVMDESVNQKFGLNEIGLEE